MLHSWQSYFERTKDNPPRALLVAALPFVTRRDAALDLGAGALNDSRYLLEQGFRHVTAIDNDPVAQAVAKTFPKDRFTYGIASFEHFAFPENAYDLVNAQFSLPFIRPDRFDAVLGKILRALRPSGIFTGQLFGDRDTWNAPGRNMTFHTHEEATRLLSTLEMLRFEEEEKEGSTALGEQKHWHILHFIAKKS